MARKKLLYIIDVLPPSGGTTDIVNLLSSLDRQKFTIELLVLTGIDSEACEFLRDCGVIVYLMNKLTPQEFNEELNRLFINIHNESISDNFFDDSISNGKSVENSRKYLSQNTYHENSISNQILNKITESNPDIVQFNNLFSEIFVGVILHKIPQHIIVIANRISKNTFISNPSLYNFIHCIIQPLIHRFVMNSHAMAKEIISTEQLAPEKVSIIYNGIDANKYRRLSGYDVALREQFNICMVANIYIAKGYWDLLQSLVIFKNLLNINFMVYCIGEDMQNNIPQFSEFIAKNNLSQNVIFLGSLPNVSDMLNLSNVFILPSHTESLPNSIIEAMICELPVISTTVGGIPEIIEPGVTGLLVPPQRPDLLANAMIEIYNQPERARQMGIHGHARAIEKFSIERYTAAYDSFYQKLWQAHPDKS